MNSHSDKLQIFKDTRFGWSATLRIDFYAEDPFIVRVKDECGRLRYSYSTKTARDSKLKLERLCLNPHGQRGNWWTVKGNVCDIE